MVANHKGEIPAALLLLPFITGVALAINFFSVYDLPWLILSLLALVVIFIFLNLFYSRLGLYKYRWLGGFLINLILLLAGALCAVRGNEINNNAHFSKFKARYLAVKINNEPVLKNGMLRFTANVEQSITGRHLQDVNGTLLITIKDTSAKKFQYGDLLLIPATYNSINPPYNPAEFNYKRYLANQSIYYQAFLYPGQFKLAGTGTGDPLISFSLKLRQKLVDKFKRNMRDTNAIAVASTLILGYKADLSNDILQAYSKTGTIHVLSVSGAHVAIIYILLAFLLGFLSRYKYGKILRAFIIVTVIGYYALISGFSPAVCRAAVMIGMFVVGKTFNRYINTLNILAVSAFALLLYNPYYLTDVGFQLSYLAVFGLIALQPMVYKWITLKNKWADKLWALCSVSIAAQVITFPLSAFYFHQFPVYFLVSNLFIIIPTTVIMYAGLFCLLLPQMPVISRLAGAVLENSILLMNKVLAVIENLPYASISKIWLSTGEYLLLYFIIIGVFYFLYDKWKWLLRLIMVAVLLLCFSLSIKTIRLSTQRNITWLNLNKHTGIVFKRQNEAVILTDLVKTDNAFRYSIQPYLDSSKISRIVLLPFNKNFSNTYFKKINGLIQFGNKKMLVINSAPAGGSYQPQLKVDYIYLTGNAQISIPSLKNNFEDPLLIMDGTNSIQRIGRWENEARIAGLNYKSLKRNKSLTLSSN